MAASFVVPLVVALCWAIWFLVASSRGDRRTHDVTGHVFRGQGEAVFQHFDSQRPPGHGLGTMPGSFPAFAGVVEIRLCPLGEREDTAEEQER